MNRALIYVAIAVSCVLSAAGGYWLGFRDAWVLSIAAETLPRAAIATHQLKFLRSGRPGPVITGLEFDVDRGLSWGHDLFDHPLRELLGTIWGLEVYPGYERYAVQLANYRKQYPSLLKPEDFEKNPALAQDARDTKAKIERMVKRYGEGLRPPS